MRALFDLSQHAGIAVATGDGTTLSFAELSRLADDLAEQLMQWAAPGARIGIAAQDKLIYAIALLGVTRQHVMVPLQPTTEVARMGTQCRQLGVDLLLTDGEGSAPSVQVRLSRDKRLQINRLCAPILPPQKRARFERIIMQTAGSTGYPKVIGYTRENLLNTCQINRDHFALGPDDTYLCPMPMFHAHGLISVLLVSLFSGASTVMCDTDPLQINAAFADFSPTFFSAAPSIHLELLRTGEPVNATAAGLRFVRSSSAPLNYDRVTALEAFFVAPLVETFGLTETTSVVVANPLDGRRIGSVGKPIGDTQAAVLSEDGKQISETGHGELLLRGRSVVMSCLDGTADDDSTMDGWLRTGDLAEIDQQGRISIRGRLKESFKRGGHLVHPIEIDRSLAALPGVAAATCFCVDHDTLGEDLVGIVQPEPGAVCDPLDLRQRLSRTLPAYKVPSLILITEALPRDACGKIVRKDIRLQQPNPATVKNGHAREVETIMMGVREFVIAETSINPADLCRNTSLFSDGLMDSFAHASLIALIENHLGAPPLEEWNDTENGFENGDTLDSLAEIETFLNRSFSAPRAAGT